MSDLPTLRYLHGDLCDGELVCLHCGETFEDWDVIEQPLQELELDAEGFNCDWPDLGHHKIECPSCQKLLVFGADPETMPYYVRGRSETDIRYMKVMNDRKG